MIFGVRIRKSGKAGPAKGGIGFSCRKLIQGVLVIAVVTVMIAPRPAKAICFCCDCLPTVYIEYGNVISELISQHIQTMIHITLEFTIHKLWMIEIFYRFYWGEALAMMTEQMSAVAMHQMFIVGGFLDAKNQLETQRLYAELTARAHKDYHPSEGLCTIGSAARSLGQADRNIDMTTMMLAQYSMDRQLMNGNANAAEGPKEDREGRTTKFLETYCDPNDDNRGLTSICKATTQARRNKDVNYALTIGMPMTLDVNFGDTTVTPDEEDVLALASNLYAHDIFRNVAEANLKDNPKNQALYLDLRAIIAKRSVAEQSFQAIAGMKSRGSSDTAQTQKYLRAIMRDLGIASDAEVDDIIGKNPSYYAQMEILTKKLFQTPDFFSDLYDQPANVARKGVALEALNLAQENDLFNSALRSEAMMSILLELRLKKAQDAVHDTIGESAQ